MQNKRLNELKSEALNKLHQASFGCNSKITPLKVFNYYGMHVSACEYIQKANNLLNRGNTEDAMTYTSLATENFTSIIEKCNHLLKEGNKDPWAF